jgi:hypothetical protein
VAGLDLFEHWFIDGAVIHRNRAPGMEAAAPWRVQWAWNISFEYDPLALPVGVWDGNGGHQRLGVGVKGSAEDLPAGSQLDYLAQIHDSDAVGDVLNDRHIVGDKQVCEIKLLLEVFEQVEHLCLYGDVKGRDGLVSNYEFGAERKGTSNTNSLPLSTGELVRVALGMIVFQTHFTEDIDHLVRALTGRANLVDAKTFSYRAADRHTGIKRGVGILEYDLHLPSQRL